MGFLREAETVQKHAAKTLAITPSQKPATALSHCPPTSPDRTVPGERKGFMPRVTQPNQLRHPFFSMDSHILMQKASKDNVALFQHAILGYYTTPSMGLLPGGAHGAHRRDPACIIGLGGGEGGLGSESCLHSWHHMWASLTLFQPL